MRTLCLEHSFHTCRYTTTEAPDGVKIELYPILPGCTSVSTPESDLWHEPKDDDTIIKMSRYVIIVTFILINNPHFL